MTDAPTHRLSSTYRFLDRLATPIAQIATRIVFGQSFLLHGLGKLKDLEKIQQSFEGLGIPLANVQAPFVALVEFVGGILLLLGLGTRISALFLACTMIVAALTAHASEFVLDAPFAKVSPVPYLVAMLWLVAKGAGSLSIDHLLARRARG